MHLALLLIFGGVWSVIIPCVSGGENDETTECYNVTIQRWELVPSLTLPNSSTDKAAFSFGGVACLAASFENLPSVLCTNGSLSGWQLVSTLLHTRPGPTPIYGGGWVGIVGAMDSNDLSWDYTTLSGQNTLSTINFSWGTASTAYRNVTGGVAIPLNGTTCVVGGMNWDSHNISNGASVCLNSPLLKWLPGPSLNTSRFHAVPLALGGGTSCVAGGENAARIGGAFTLVARQSTVECVRIGGNFTQSWLTLPTTVAYAANISINGLACISGGEYYSKLGLLSLSAQNVICANATAAGDLTGWLYAPNLTIGRALHASFNIDTSFIPTATPTPTRSPTIHSPTSTLTTTQNPTLTPTVVSLTQSPTSRNPTSTPITASPSGSFPATPTSSPTSISGGSTPSPASTRFTCVSGGTTAIPELDTAITECYDNQTRQWEIVPAMTLPNPDIGLTAYNIGPIACLTGEKIQMICFNTSTAEWFPVAAPKYLRSYAAALYSGSGVSIAGGVYKQITPPITWEVVTLTTSDGLPGSWSFVSGFPAGYGMAVLVLNGSICAVGGTGPNGTRVNAACLEAGVWKDGPSLTAPRRWPTSLEISEQIYELPLLKFIERTNEFIKIKGRWCVVGGISDLPTAVECIDDAGNFTVVGSINTSLYIATNVSIHGLSCVAGGALNQPNRGVLNDVVCVNGTDTGAWSWLTLPPLKIARGAHTSFFLDADKLPFTSSPTLAPTKAPTVNVATVVVDSKTSSTADNLQGVISSPPPPTGQASVRIVIDVMSTTDNRTTEAIAQDLASRVLTTISLQLQLNNNTAAALLLLNSRVTVTVTNSSTKSNTKVFTIVIQVDGAIAQQVTTTIAQNNGTLAGYHLDGVYIRWPSVILFLTGLTSVELAVVIAIFALVAIVVVGVHLRAKDMKGLLNFQNLITTVFSFALSLWFFTVLLAAATTTNQIIQTQTSVAVTTHDGSIFFPYMIAYAVSLFLTPLLNMLALVFGFSRIQRKDSSLTLWIRVHPYLTAIIKFFSLVSMSNLFMLSSSLLKTAAPMTMQTRLSLSALGLWGGVLELPRLVIQFVLIANHSKENAAAAAWLPLAMSALAFFSTVLQRCYALGYLRGNPEAIKEEWELKERQGISHTD